jgi:hypothetical protein
VKQNQIEKAIANLEAQREVIDLAIAKLSEQAKPAPQRTPRKPKKAEKDAL